MVFGFDPRKLIKDQQEEEKKKVEEVVSAQEKYDIALEEKEAKLRKKSNIKDALASADKALREYKFLKKYGMEEYVKAKRLQDPDWDKKTFRDLEGFFDGAKVDWSTGDYLAQRKRT